MALKLKHMYIQNFMSGDAGALQTVGHKLYYIIEDDVDPRLRCCSDLVVDEIVPTDTVATWWGKVIQQVKTKENIT